MEINKVRKYPGTVNFHNPVPGNTFLYDKTEFMVIDEIPDLEMCDDCGDDNHINAVCLANGDIWHMCDDELVEQINGIFEY